MENDIRQLETMDGGEVGMDIVAETDSEEITMRVSRLFSRGLSASSHYQFRQ